MEENCPLLGQGTALWFLLGLGVLAGARGSSVDVMPKDTAVSAVCRQLGTRDLCAAFSTVAHTHCPLHSHLLPSASSIAHCPSNHICCHLLQQ
eukprot:1157925-Pelagomonas_calceolata.AAC.4